MNLPCFEHPTLSRRAALQAGAVGLLGLGTNHLEALRAAVPDGTVSTKPRSVIYIFLSGGLAQQDSFDMKPDAPDNVRGDFKPIDTATPGLRICEHLPGLAQRSSKWSIVRSLTHPYNGAFAGTHGDVFGAHENAPDFSCQQTDARGLAQHRLDRRRLLSATQQSAAGGCATRTIDSPYGPSHSRPVRRRYGFPARSMVY